MKEAVRAPETGEPVGDGGRRNSVLAPTRTESFWLVRLYRVMIPRALRSRIAGRVSPDFRNQVILRAASGGPLRRIKDRLANAWFRVRHPMLVAPANRSLIREDGRLRVAEIAEVITPLQARRETLDLVCGALDAADVPYFCVRPLSESESAVAVPESARDRALTALAEAAGPAAAYVAPGTGEDGDLDGWPRVARSAMLRMIRYLSTPDGLLVLGGRYGCVVEFWREDGTDLVAPRPNRVAERVPASGTLITAPEEMFTPLAPAGESHGRYRTRADFAGRLVNDVGFPVDIVYTWVDGSDPVWRARRDAELAGIGAASLNDQAANDARYISRDELRYSLRGVAMYAPWVRHIWIVTDGQTPDWLDASHPKITVVDHKELFGDRGALPTFNSHAIESQLHHIEGLAEHFLYFNDDFFLGRPVVPAHFFQANGVTKFFPSKAQVALGERTVADLPVLAAGKNNRRLIEDAFGQVLVQKMKHVPYALRRSVLSEIEERFQPEAAETARHRFRHPDDIAIPSSLHHYYGFLTSRATEGQIEYSYTDLAARETPYRLRRMLSLRQYDVFCLNDTDSDQMAQAKQLDLMNWFLKAYFPVPSPYELPS